MAPKPKEPTRAVSRTNKKLSDYFATSKAPAKSTSKVKITGSASSSGGKANTPSISRGTSIAQSPKITGGKVAAKKPSLASQATKAASKVVGRAKTVAREARDIPTAVGTVIRATAAGKPKAGTNTPTNKQAMYAKYDLKKQVRQVGTAIKTGKKGTAAVRYGKK